MKKMLYLFAVLTTWTTIAPLTATALSFTAGATQSLSVCENSSSRNIDSLLAADDPATGDTDTWSAAVLPLHGTLAASYSAIAAGAILMPSGLTYTPAAGYAGTDSFTVQVSNGSTLTYTTVYVTVNPLPVATFTASPVYHCSPNDTVTFAAGMASASGIAYYEWHFGDGNNTADTATTNPAIHIYTASGIFTDTLQVTDNNSCSVFVTNNTAPVKIAPPAFSISIPVDSGCAPFVFSFNTGILPLTSYTINTIRYGDSCCAYIPPAGTTAGTHVYTAGGVYTMQITYTLPASAGGCTYTSLKRITVGTTHPAFDPVLSADSVCPNTLLHVVCNCTNCTSFLWNFNGPAFPAVSNEYACDTDAQFSTQGTYYIRAIADDAGCTDTVVTNVYVLPPAAAIVASVPDCSNPDVVQFSSSGSVGATGFRWYFGDGTMATGSSPVHTYPIGVEAVYTVTLTDTGGGSHLCTNTSRIAVYIFPFNDTMHASILQACPGQIITFTGSLTDYGTHYAQYIWHWGDGTAATTSVSNTATHAYLRPGTYTDSLIVTNSLGCSDTAFRTNYITIAGPRGGLTVNGSLSDTGCAPLVATLLDNDTDQPGVSIISRHWNLNANSVSGTGVPGNILVTATAADTSLIYPAGSYTIFVVDSDNIGCTVTDTVHITAEQPHPYFYSEDSNLTACIGIPIPFHDTNTHCLYEWNFGDGSTGTGQNPVHIYTANGFYTVSATIITTAGGSLLPGCMATYTRPSYINVGNINVSYNISATYSFCPPLYVVGSNTTSPLSEYSYQWRISPFGSIVSTTPNLYYILTSGGIVYDITLIATNSIGCTDSVTQTVRIMGPAGYISLTPDMSCVPATAMLCFNDTNAVAPTSFTWSFGDGTSFITTDSCIAHVYSATGVFHPFVIISSSGCEVTIPMGPEIAFTDSMQVLSVPVMSITPSTATICYGDNIFINASGASSLGNYRWYPGYALNDSTIPNVLASPTVITTYSVVETNLCGSDTAGITVNVLPLPIPVISFSGSILTAAGPYVAYQWYKDSTAIAGATYDTCSVTDSGRYAVSVTDSAGCSAVATYMVTLTVEKTPGINSTVNIYPNPAQSTLFIQSSTKVNTTVTAIDGRELMRKNDVKELDLSALPDGIYLINIFNNHTGLWMKTDRLVKEEH